MRISDWSSDVCSSDLRRHGALSVVGVSRHEQSRRNRLRSHSARWPPEKRYRPYANPRRTVRTHWLSRLRIQTGCLVSARQVPLIFRRSVMAASSKKSKASAAKDTAPADRKAFKPKKSVALSGIVAGNTGLCTVGRSGNDLHYRGYDILDIAETCEFEEIAHLLIHGKLPTRPELTAYKQKLRRLRGLPAQLQVALEALPAASHPMDVMRTATSVLGCVLPEKDETNIPDARHLPAHPMANIDPPPT